MSNFMHPLSSFVVYPAIEQSKTTQNTLNPTVSVSVSWKLPKWGAARDGCGDVSGVKACPNGDDKPVLLHNRCFRPECPICYDSWANRDAGHILDRIESGECLYHKVGKKLCRIRHYSFSPPQDWAVRLMNTVDGYKELRSEAVNIIKGEFSLPSWWWIDVPYTDIIKPHGLSGGCIIFHSHRKKFVLGVPVWYYSPHFHVVGYGYVMCADSFYRLTGWVYKNKGVRNTVYGTIFYLLTHAGLGYVDDRRVFHCNTWFGVMGYSRMVIKSDVRKVVYEKCKVCAADLHLYDVGWCKKSDFSDRENWQDVGYYVRVVRVRTFMLRNYRKHKVVCLRVDGEYG